MSDSLPPRVKAAESRARFREMLDASSLGDPEAKAAIERTRRRNAALPDRWVHLRESDLTFFLDMYRIHRETWNEDHATAVATVLSEIDFDSSQCDLDEIPLSDEVIVDE